MAKGYTPQEREIINSVTEMMKGMLVYFTDNPNLFATVVHSEGDTHHTVTITRSKFLDLVQEELTELTLSRSQLAKLLDKFRKGFMKYLDIMDKWDPINAVQHTESLTTFYEKLQEDPEALLK